MLSRDLDTVLLTIVDLDKFRLSVEFRVSTVACLSFCECQALFFVPLFVVSGRIRAMVQRTAMCEVALHRGMAVAVWGRDQIESACLAASFAVRTVQISGEVARLGSDSDGRSQTD